MKKIVLLLLAATVMLGGCSSGTAKNPPGEREAVQAAAQADAQDVYLLAGKLESKEITQVVSKTSAKVSKITVDVGAPVKKGDPLIYLDTKDAAAQVETAKAGVNLARANLDKVKKGARTELVEQLKASLASAGTGYENAKLLLERTKKLFEEDAVSRQQLETVQGQYAAAEAQYKSAKEQLDIASSGETKETIQVLEEQVKQAEAVLGQAEAQQDNYVITAPVSGIISSRSLNEGEMAAAGASLLTVVNSEDTYINSYVPLNMVGMLKVDQKVFISFLEVPDRKYTGKIQVINPAVDARNKTVPVRISIDDADSSLMPGTVSEIGLIN